MKRINERVLQPGDIVLTTTVEAISAIIRCFTKSDISHAMICVGHSSVIDATADGVHARNVQREVFDDGCSIHIMRLRSSLSATQLNELCNYAREQVGTEYSTREAIKASKPIKALFGGGEWTRKQFCSRLVAQAFAHVGIDIVPDPNYCSPAELKESLLLAAVPSPTVPVDSEELMRVNWGDLAERMRAATNALFEAARAKSRNIQTFDDLNKHVVLHPQDDAELCTALQNSGYLSVWMEERLQSPWRYDLQLMDTLPHDFVEHWCRIVMQEAANGGNRFTISLSTLIALGAQYPRTYFVHMIALYRHLVSDQEQRVNVVKQWLRSRNLQLP